MAKRFRAEGGGFSGLWEVFVARLVSSEVEGAESLGFLFFLIFFTDCMGFITIKPPFGRRCFYFFQTFYAKSKNCGELVVPDVLIE